MEEIDIEPSQSIENEIYQQIINDDGKFIAEALKALENAPKELQFKNQQPLKSNLLVTFASFLLSNPKNENFNRVGEALFWAHYFDTMNDEVFSTLREIGCESLDDQNQIQEAASAYVKREEKNGNNGQNMEPELKGYLSPYTEFCTEEETDAWWVLIEECELGALDESVRDLEI